MARYILRPAPLCEIPNPNRARRVFGTNSAQVRLMMDGTARFRYDLDMHSPGDYFECSMFCEIGEPYKPRIREVMREFGIVLGDTKELDQLPWYADTIKEYRK
jgi:hypothetical protein